MMPLSRIYVTFFLVSVCKQNFCHFWQMQSEGSVFLHQKAKDVLLRHVYMFARWEYLYSLLIAVLLWLLAWKEYGNA